MSYIKDSRAPSPSSAASALPGSERPDYRGKCLYKTGKCVNERAVKTSGAAHNLCNEHRNRQNAHQRKLDAKNRLHKRERQVFPPDRFTPYPPAATKRQPLNDTADDVASGDKAVSSASNSGSASTDAMAVATSVGATSSSTKQEASSVMILPNSPQPPQVAYSFGMQDFDGIVVPLPSYLEGQERLEFRSRIYRKVLDFISEECILRFGAKAESSTVSVITTSPVEDTLPRILTSSRLEAEDQSIKSEKKAQSVSHDHPESEKEAQSVCHDHPAANDAV